MGLCDFRGKAKTSMDFDMLICQCDIQVEISNSYGVQRRKKRSGLEIRYSKHFSTWKELGSHGDFEHAERMLESSHICP